VKIHEKIHTALHPIGQRTTQTDGGSTSFIENRIIGKAGIKKGEPHAEVNAINSVKRQTLLKKATVYVSLEPCSHFGKPPCSDFNNKNKILQVLLLERSDPLT
jgi:diaminohydroxyphosphoribosylaminopyrimidine deaminase/5-amino-6-(5-phosphoribosylamino)uracil reductase